MQRRGFLGALGAMMVPKPVLALAANTKTVEIVAPTIAATTAGAGSLDAFFMAEAARITKEIWERRYESAYTELASTKTYETK